VPKSRDEIRMTQSEVADYLREQKIMTLGTIGPDGVPHLVAMSYGLLDGSIVWWSYAKSQKVVNVTRDPRVAVLVESGARGEVLKGVSITGVAEIVRDPEFVVQKAGRAIYAQMHGRTDTEAGSFLARVGDKRVAVVVRPTRIRSWDHSKLQDYWLAKGPKGERSE
jgi:PPOX class probable F420-dependent enzyme